MIQLYIYTTRGCVITSEKVAWGAMAYHILYGRPSDPSRLLLWAIGLPECYLVYTTANQSEDKIICIPAPTYIPS